MICPQCAAQLLDGTEKCPKCGADLAAQAQQPASASEQLQAAVPGAAAAAAPQSQQPVLYQPPAYSQQPQGAQAQQAGAYQGQQPYQQGYAQPGNPAGVDDKSTMFIVFSVLEFFFCGGLIAIWPFVMAMNYKNAVARGDLGEIEAKRKSTRTALIVTLVLGIVLTILAVIALFFIVLAAGTYSYHYSFTDYSPFGVLFQPVF